MNKCIKVAIKSCNELSKSELNTVLKDLQYLTCKASNKAMRMYYLWENEKFEHKEINGEYPSEKERFGKTYRNIVCAEMKKIMTTAYARNVDQTNAYVAKKWNTDKKDIINNRKSLANYKNNMPIYICNDGYKIIQENKGYEVDIALFNRTQERTHLVFNIDKLDGNKKATLNKIIDSKYKQGASWITQDRHGKWYLNISFSFESNTKKLDINRILGIDLGVTNAVTMQIWDDNRKEWERLSWKECMLDGKELIHLRQKIESRRIALLKNSKLAEFNKGKAGHGRKTRTKAVENMSDKVKNFRDTLNHKYSRYIVDFAVKHNCGVIQMENLEGFTEKTKESFLKNWSYFDLQFKIKYKAEELGIKTLKVKPQYTSKRCSECGCIHEENRNCKNNQAKFKCVVCGYTENADINASKNLAIPAIDEIIKEQLKEAQ